MQASPLSGSSSPQTVAGHDIDAKDITTSGDTLTAEDKDKSRVTKYLHTVKANVQHAFSRDADSSPNDENTRALVLRFQGILHHVEQYRKLLTQRASPAQKLLDTLQWQRRDSEASRDSFRLVTSSGVYFKKGNQHPIAAGGFADIYKGVFQGQAVCLKALRVHQSTKMDDFIKNFSREAILWGQLSHPNVLPIYGLYRLRTRVCLVPPWMEFGDITRYLEYRPDACRLPLALDITEGLRYLHSNGIVHGDLKGPDILVSNAGVACLADFGISSISDSAIPAWTSHSSIASRGGSIRWHAPELFDTETDEVVKNNVQSDTYALACVFYEVLTGTVPFDSTQLDTVVALKVMSGARPTRPSESSVCWKDWRLTETIWSLMQDCWTEIPSERPALDQIINQLRSVSVPRKRSSVKENILPPARFRQKVSRPLDMITVSTLERLLELCGESKAENNRARGATTQRWHIIGKFADADLRRGGLGGHQVAW
ncbi:kinase-like domain-containing protein [Lyophyllum atratum]|nr:kinase-like domain-containing protein [Lyophyllum atratum]